MKSFVNKVLKLLIIIKFKFRKIVYNPEDIKLPPTQEVLAAAAVGRPRTSSRHEAGATPLPHLRDTCSELLWVVPALNTLLIEYPRNN